MLEKYVTNFTQQGSRDAGNSARRLGPYIFFPDTFFYLMFFITEYISEYKNNHAKTVGSGGSGKLAKGRKKWMVKHVLSGIQKYRR